MQFQIQIIFFLGQETLNLVVDKIKIQESIKNTSKSRYKP